MSALLALLLAQQSLVPVAPTPQAPPADWATMPPLPLPARDTGSADSRFVREEVAAGHCPVTARTLTAPVAVLVGPRAEVQRIVPRAIGCPAVEQYSAGYASTLLRTLDDGGPVPAPGWYRFAITYRW